MQHPCEAKVYIDGEDFTLFSEIQMHLGLSNVSRRATVTYHATRGSDVNLERMFQKIINIKNTTRFDIKIGDKFFLKNGFLTSKVEKDQDNSIYTLSIGDIFSPLESNTKIWLATNYNENERTSKIIGNVLEELGYTEKDYILNANSGVDLIKVLCDDDPMIKNKQEVASDVRVETAHNFISGILNTNNLILLSDGVGKLVLDNIRAPEDIKRHNYYEEIWTSGREAESVDTLRAKLGDEEVKDLDPRRKYWYTIKKTSSEDLSKIDNITILYRKMENGKIEQNFEGQVSKQPQTEIYSRYTFLANSIKSNTLNKVVVDNINGTPHLHEVVKIKAFLSIPDLKKLANVRAAKDMAQAYQYTITVPKWYDTTGFLWELNTNIKVIDEMHDINNVLLIKDISLKWSADSGHRTDLTLCNPIGFTMVSVEEMIKKENEKDFKRLKKQLKKNKSHKK